MRISKRKTHTHICTYPYTTHTLGHKTYVHKHLYELKCRYTYMMHLEREII